MSTNQGHISFEHTHPPHEYILSNNKYKKVSEIKNEINEIINLIAPPAKNIKITDNDLVDLLQYYDLINELETTNG